MPTMSNVVLADRETTPVNHTFVPNFAPNGVLYMRNRVSGVPIADEVLSISSRVSGKRMKDKFVLTLPVVQTQVINGVSSPVLLRRNTLDMTFTFDELSTDQERKNLMGMAYALLGTAQSQIVDIVVNRSPAR